MNLAHSLLYLLRGAPVVYYGDEFGIIGRGGDKEARQGPLPDPGGGVAHRPSGRLGADRQRIVVRRHGPPGRRAFARARPAAGRAPGLSVGATVVRQAQGATLAVSRLDASAGREYLAVFNNGETTVRVTVPTRDAVRVVDCLARRLVGLERRREAG